MRASYFRMSRAVIRYGTAQEQRTRTSVQVQHYWFLFLERRCSPYRRYSSTAVVKLRSVDGRRPSRGTAARVLVVAVVCCGRFRSISSSKSQQSFAMSIAPMTLVGATAVSTWYSIATLMTPPFGNAFRGARTALPRMSIDIGACKPCDSIRTSTKALRVSYLTTASDMIIMWGKKKNVYIYILDIYTVSFSLCSFQTFFVRLTGLAPPMVADTPTRIHPTAYILYEAVFFHTS